MSVDLEKLADHYARLEDHDLSLILYGVAEASRKRGRPDHVLTFPEVDRGISLEEIDAAMQASKDRNGQEDDKDTYLKIQRNVLDIFTELAPKRTRRYTIDERLTIASKFNDEYGKKVLDVTALKYFALPTLSTVSLEEKGRTPLFEEMDKIDLGFRILWNRMIHAMTASERLEMTIGAYRAINDKDITEIKNVGSIFLQLFRAAFSP